MNNTELIDYINSQLELGVGETKIRESILSKGWNQGQVDEAFSRVNLSSKLQRNNLLGGGGWVSNVQLIVTNVVIIYLAIYQKWNMIDVFLVYWIQSIIIGFFHFIKLIYCKKDVLEFCIFYVLFHFLSFVAIIAIGRELVGIPSTISFYDDPEAFIDFSEIIFPAVAFLLNHFVSFEIHIKKEIKDENWVTNLKSFPFDRIIIMHLAILLGAGLGFPTVVFLVIRGAADYISHLYEHRDLNSDKFGDSLISDMRFNSKIFFRVIFILFLCMIAIFFVQYFSAVAREKGGAYDFRNEIRNNLKPSINEN